ncbi:MAG: hypothetical protein KAI43_09125 [Candidatus Aureabacteria bacterium]|nr:hypothetical protein [Candidatus Auribacterota bacterium]
MQEDPLKKEIRENILKGQFQAIENLRKWTLSVITLSSVIFATVIPISGATKPFKNDCYIVALFFFTFIIISGIFKLKNEIIKTINELPKTHEELINLVNKIKPCDTKQEFDDLNREIEETCKVESSFLSRYYYDIICYLFATAVILVFLSYFDFILFTFPI